MPTTPATTAAAPEPSREQRRRRETGEAIARIQAIHLEQGITRESLAATAGVLEQLALQRDLFSFEDFPAAAGAQASARYALHVQDDQTYALYLNVQKPGKNSVPHDHRTWAVISAVSGEELNRIYRRTDGGSVPGRATLALEREVVVRPGTSVAYLGDDIHSIHVSGTGPTLHFHLYGRALETLTERVAFDLETGTVGPYNKAHWRPNAG